MDDSLSLAHVWPMIYLDHHATTPVDPAVLEAMLPYFCEKPGNAASTHHQVGLEARGAVEGARAQVASLIGASAREIAFTSGATESDNLAIKGVAEATASRGKHIISQRTEHKAVLDSLKRLGRRGYRITLLDVDTEGRLDPQAVADAMTDDTVLVSVMWTNNEVGTHQDLAAIGEITRRHDVWLHCDASQGLGYLPMDVGTLPVDLVSFTAHKIYGPKGVGALYARRRNPRVQLIAEMDGGGHEGGMRSGTLNVPGIVGFGMAAQMQRESGEAEAARLRTLRAKLYDRLSAEAKLVLNGPALEQPRHPGNLNVSFAGIDGGSLMVALASAVAVSTGSACSSGNSEPSYVLRAMGLDRERAAASVRFGLGRHTTEAQIDEAATRVLKAVAHVAQGGW